MENTNWDQRYTEGNTPWDSGIPSTKLKQFLSAGFVKRGQVLELGCGTGTNAIYLAQSGFQVTAVDISGVAIKMAREKAQKAGVSITFLQSDVTSFRYDGPAFPFVFDRGTYHVVRNVNLEGFQKTLCAVVEPGGFYLVLAGNANEEPLSEKGPPRVTAHELCKELEFGAFHLVSLEETHFDRVKIEGVDFSPLAWKAVLRRRINVD